MFGVQRLKDEIEGLQEERNYFRSKFLEQVSEITALKEALHKSEKEVARLRKKVMSSPRAQEEKKEDDLHKLSSLSQDSADDEDSADEDEQAAIRKKAEQLVRWASYRQEVSTPPPKEEEMLEERSFHTLGEERSEQGGQVETEE